MSKSKPYDKEIADTEGTLLRVYSTVDEQSSNRRVEVRVLSDALSKELVFDKAKALGFINSILGALGSGTEIKLITGVSNTSIRKG